MSKTVGEHSNVWIAAFGGQGSHVEQAPDLLAATENAGSTSVFAGLAIERGYPNQSGDLMAIELTQFGQMSQQHGAGLRANPRSAAQDGVFVTEVIVGLDVVLDDIVELANLGFQGFDYSFDATADFSMVYHFGTVGFLGEHVGELSASANQFGQSLRLWLSGRSIRGFDQVPKKSEDIGIDGVGLGVFAETFCEMTDLAGIDHDRLESGLDQFSSESAFVSAGCFQDDLSDIESLESGEELSVTLGSIGVITVELGWVGGDLERILSDINSDIQWCGHGSTPFLPMRASLSAAQAAVRVNPIATTRTMLRGGLDDPVTIGLTPSVADSARCAPLSWGLHCARLADNYIIYGILYHV